MNNLTLILLYIISPSPIIKQTMAVSPFADSCKKQGTTPPYILDINCLQVAAAAWEDLQPKS
jgi:hypothetical protein